MDEAGAYNLIIAVLKQAKRDYISSILRMDYYHMNEIEEFLLSDYGETMSLHNGERIINLCWRKAKEIKKKRRNGKWQ